MGPEWTAVMVRYSKQDALSDAEFDRLVEAAYTLDEPFAAQAAFVLFVSGQLSLRAGGLAQIIESWID